MKPAVQQKFTEKCLAQIEFQEYVARMMWRFSTPGEQDIHLSSVDSHLEDRDSSFLDSNFDFTDKKAVTVTILGGTNGVEGLTYRLGFLDCVTSLTGLRNLHEEGFNAVLCNGAINGWQAVDKYSDSLDMLNLWWPILEDSFEMYCNQGEPVWKTWDRGRKIGFAQGFSEGYGQIEREREVEDAD